MAEASGSNDLTDDDLIRQVVALSSKVAVLESRQRATPPSQPQEPVGSTSGLPPEVKAPVPASINGAYDGDSVKNFVDSVDTYFGLVGMRGGIHKARFASVLVKGKARTCFMVQGFALNDKDDDISLTWHVLKQQLLMHFRPADYKRLARKITIHVSNWC